MLWWICYFTVSSEVCSSTVSLLHVTVSDDLCSPVYRAMFDNVSKVTAFDTSGPSCACKFIFKGPWVTLNPGMMSSAPALLLLSPVVCYQGPSCFPCKQQTCCYLVTRTTSCPPRSRLTGPYFFTLFSLCSEFETNPLLLLEFNFWHYCQYHITPLI